MGILQVLGHLVTITSLLPPYNQNTKITFNYLRIIKAMLATLGDQLYVQPICLACRLTPERISRGLG